MTHLSRPLPWALVGLVLLTSTAPAAEIVWPQNRGAFFSTESIEVAVAGLAKGAAATLELQPQKPGAAVVKVDVKGDGSTVTVVLPPLALAPDATPSELDGKDAGKLTISTGVQRSTCCCRRPARCRPTAGPTSSSATPSASVCSTPKGMPRHEAVRGQRSPGLSAFETAVATDLPTLVYMYWTGYVTHKPFGNEKSWAATRMDEAMRLLSFHTRPAAAQIRHRHRCASAPSTSRAWPGARRRRAAWPAASPTGTRKLVRERGWKYTQDIAGQSDADWMKYMTVRCGIIKEKYDQARRRTSRACGRRRMVGTDLYAPHAIMDGTDPLNQQVNDVPPRHVFFDWCGGPIGALSGRSTSRKPHDPAAKLAHAMNGQLIGTLPRPDQRAAVPLLMNAHAGGGLHSNWWLNTGGMTNEDLEAVNEPGCAMGPLFREMAPKGHDVARAVEFHRNRHAREGDGGQGVEEEDWRADQAAGATARRRAS